MQKISDEEEKVYDDYVSDMHDLLETNVQKGNFLDYTEGYYRAMVRAKCRQLIVKLESKAPLADMVRDLTSMGNYCMMLRAKRNG